MMDKIVKDKSNRILEIDLLRGIAVMFMILDHIMYDLWGLLPSFFNEYPDTLFNIGVDYWLWDFRNYFRYFILFIFLALVGICGSFSKSNVKRGTKLLGIALLLTLGTYIFSYKTGDFSNFITFGALHCIALSLIFIGVLNKYIKDKWFYLVLGLIMIISGIYFESDIVTKNLTLYSNYIDVFKVLFGQIIGSIQSGGDTMSFLLNGGQVMVGVFLGKLLYEKRKSIFNWKYSNNIVTFIGRNSLLIYFLHQVIVPVLGVLILLVFGYSLAI